MNDERFWSKVRKGEGCWEWTAGKGAGYGKMGRTINGKMIIMGAHRYAYMQAYGPIAPGLCVLHKCHNRACVRPEHLRLGTLAENCADTGRAGRARNQHTGKLFVEPMPMEFFRWCAGGLS